MAETAGKFVPANSGEQCQVLGITVTFKVTSEDSDGAFSLQNDWVAPNFRAPLHLHRSHTETFTILEGDAEVEVGPNKMEAVPGMTIHIPKGVPHAVTVGGDGLRMTTLVTPGGFARFFREIAALAAPEPDKIAALAARYDTEFLEPLAA